MSKEDVLYVVYEMSRQQNTHTLKISDVLNSFNGKFGMTSDTNAFIDILQELSENKKLVINDSETITVSSYFLKLYTEYYSSLYSGKKSSFPSVTLAPKALPQSILIPIDAANFFGKISDSSATNVKPEDRGKLFSIRFFGSLPAIIYPSDVPLNELLIIAVRPVRQELDKKEEFSRYSSKLISTRPEASDTIRKILSRFSTGSSSLTNMVVGSKINIALFEQLFSSMSNTVFINYVDSPEKTHLLQCLEILMSLLQFCSDTMKDDRKAADTEEAIYASMKRPPYIFTMQDILRFKDSMDVLLTDTCDTSLISGILKNMLTPPNSQTPADLITVSPLDCEKTYILTEKILPYVMNEILAVREKISDELRKEWLSLKMNFLPIPERENAAEFEKKLNYLLKVFAPELHWILFSNVFWHVYFNQTQENPGFGKTWACFDGIKLQPLSKILNLYSEVIYATVLKELPSSYKMPIISWFVKFFIKISGNRKNDVTKTVITMPGQQTPETIKKLNEMEEILLSGSRGLDDELVFLSDKWNILIEKNAHDNLLIDTNELIKDYFRREIQRTRSFPRNVDELQSHAEKIIQRHLSHSQIKNKSAFNDYIMLFLFKLMKRTDM